MFLVAFIAHRFVAPISFLRAHKFIVAVGQDKVHAIEQNSDVLGINLTVDDSKLPELKKSTNHVNSHVGYQYELLLLLYFKVHGVCIQLSENVLNCSSLFSIYEDGVLIFLVGFCGN